MYDTFSGWVRCPECKEFNRSEIQFEWHECTLSYYSIGDYVDGNEPFTVFDREEMACEQCSKTFTSHALGSYGHVYGFCNERELAELQKTHPFNEKTAFVNIAISKEYLEQDMEAALLDLKTAYLKNPSDTRFVITEDQIDTLKTDTLVCRIPAFVQNPDHRFGVGDTCYYDNRSSQFELWSLEDVEATVIGRDFDEGEQCFIYQIKLRNGLTFQQIHERRLVNQKERDKRVERIEKIKKDLLEYAELDTKERDRKEDRLYHLRQIHVKLHYGKIIEQMKENGELPESFHGK